MGSAIAAWFAEKGAGLLLGALAKLALDAWQSYRDDQARQDLGRAQAEAEQGRGTIAAQQAELQAQADAPHSADEAIRRLEEGSA
ncbi:hypothetical protein XI09_42190 [Bradyrhizobium sp. CCBAU 11386]|uniref:hypothetical protein n=1 Tax=Bradyrhizobium sp. CCBAU 11386 TaxID=1630837 RepID=UPI0023043FAC|nr:hypothetical protein [Bradyrhizobium sp. CCBAU 11386]MDA9511154.1 hypothetical protein [Bradyrhizobium sp. CCBAU 11386]